MKPKLPRISGLELIKLLSRNFGFIPIRQKGSHVTLTNDNIYLTVPLHKELDRGTLHAILKKANIAIEEFMKYV